MTRGNRRNNRGVNTVKSKALLRDAVTKDVTISVNGVEKVIPFVAKPALEVSECLVCGAKFQRERINTMAIWELSDVVIGDIADSSLLVIKIPTIGGHEFAAEQFPICSATCAQDVIDGKWRTLFPDYGEDAVLECLNYCHTSSKTEAELVAEWEALPDREPVIA